MTTTQDELAELDRRRAIQQRLDEAAGLWTPFIKTFIITQRATGEEFDIREEGYIGCFANNRYTVMVRPMYREQSIISAGLEQPLWLSIRREDRAPVRSWRDMQRVKDEIAGPDREAVEIFPADARLVDTANQYHLWVMPPGTRVPFGFEERLVLDADTVVPDSPGGHVQHALVEAVPFIRERLSKHRAWMNGSLGTDFVGDERSELLEMERREAIIEELTLILTQLGGVQ